MQYLLDTNVVSALRRDTEPAVRDWAAAQDATALAISVITVMEIDIGIRRRERSDPTQASVLRRWFDERVLTGFRGRILPVDLDTARHAAAFHVPDPAPQRDALIAATAASHGLTVVTRNESDFRRTGVATVNPWTHADG